MLYEFKYEFLGIQNDFLTVYLLLYEYPLLLTFTKFTLSNEISMAVWSMYCHGSHFFELTNFPDFSSIFWSFPVFFKVLFYLKYGTISPYSRFKEKNTKKTPF